MFIITVEKPKYGEHTEEEVFRCKTYEEACLEYEKIMKKENWNSWNIYRILKK